MVNKRDVTKDQIIKKLEEIIKNNTSDGDMLSFVMSTRQALVQLASIQLMNLGVDGKVTVGDQVDKIFPPPPTPPKKNKGNKKNGKQ